MLLTSSLFLIPLVIVLVEIPIAFVAYAIALRIYAYLGIDPTVRKEIREWKANHGSSK